MKHIFFVGKKILAGTLCTIVVLVGAYAPLTPHSVPKAHALIVFDPANFGVNSTQTIIMQVLNGLAWTVAKQAIQTMTRSVVTWINSGFEGSPAFATDLSNMLRRIGDGVAAQFVSELLNNTSINSPYLERAISAVSRGYLLYTSRERIVERLRYTLNEYSANEEAFRRGNFNEGGFNAWFAMTRQCGNDPFCVEAAAREELLNQIDTATRNRLEELDWGRGFLSWRNCPDAGQADGTNTTAGATELTDAESTAGCTISTPGSVIESALIENVNSPLRQLELADSINEIVGALASQLVSQVLGGTGLLGTTQPSSGGGRSYLGQVADDATATTTSNLYAGFEQAVRAERNRISTNQRLWQEFRVIALSAVDACTNETSADATKRTDAATAVATADAAIAKASDTIATLDQILADTARVNTLPRNTRSALIQQATNDYNGVLATGNVDAPVETLTARITDIADNGCD